jgi:hypothetical protein
MTEKAGPARKLAVRTEVRGWREAFPPAQWLAAYRLQWFPHDALAGVTLAACGIPVSLAYASLAGLPPQYGIYCYLVGGLFYALFGRRISVADVIDEFLGTTGAGGYPEP